MAGKDSTATIVAVTAISLTVLALGLAFLFLRQQSSLSAGPVKVTPTADGGFTVSDVRRF